MSYTPPPVSNEIVNVTKIGTPVGDTPIYIFADVLEELRYSALHRTARGMLMGMHQVKAPTVRYVSLKSPEETDVLKGVSEMSGVSDGCRGECERGDAEKGGVAESRCVEGDATGADLNGRRGKSAWKASGAALASGGESEENLEGAEYVIVTAFKDIYPIEDAFDYAVYLRRQRNFRSENEKETVVGTVMLSGEPWKITLEDLMLQRTYCASEWQVALFVDASESPARAFLLTKELSQFTETGYYLVSAKE